jgi:hypothetical protein
VTFSDKHIIDAVKQNFVPVWEAVAPAAIARFDLGDGESVQGTIGGEIALYFCRPDGVVFDCLPALQSPAVTRAAIERAATFYAESKGAPDAAIKAYNAKRRDLIAKAQGIDTRSAAEIVGKAHAKLAKRMAMGDAADDALSVSVFSKTLMITPAETVTVIEPGGLWLYAIQIHHRIATSDLGTPETWKKPIFEQILGQPLNRGGVTEIDSTTLAPLSLTQ